MISQSFQIFQINYISINSKLFNSGDFWTKIFIQNAPTNVKTSENWSEIWKYVLGHLIVIYCFCIDKFEGLIDCTEIIACISHDNYSQYFFNKIYGKYSKNRIKTHQNREIVNIRAYESSLFGCPYQKSKNFQKKKTITHNPLNHTDREDKNENLPIFSEKSKLFGYQLVLFNSRIPN